MDKHTEHNAENADFIRAEVDDNNFTTLSFAEESESEKIKKSLDALKRFVNTPVNKEFPFA